MVKSVYIHIPLCKSKCHYCSFISFNKLNLCENYLNALDKQICTNYKGEELKTLYIGGGTPSVLTCSQIRNIISRFNISKNTEITVETNPEDLGFEYLKDLKNTGINRLSIGCQSFDDEILKLINRRHNSQKVTDSVKIAQNAGFDNINLDFIYGLPNQTESMFLNDLEYAISLGIQHISLYGLKLEEGCYFYKNPPKNIADDDTQANMYTKAVELMKNNGFEHYEVSNFARKGYESKHNLTYWNNEEYYGFGVGAHGCENKIRYANSETIEQYIQNPNFHIEETKQTPQSQLEEEIFLGLRKIAGINVENINKKYNIDFEIKYKDILNKYTKLNLLKRTQKGYAFTLEGILLSNVVLADFIE